MALRKPERSALVGGALVVRAFLLSTAIVSAILATWWFFFFHFDWRFFVFASLVSEKSAFEIPRAKLSRAPVAERSADRGAEKEGANEGRFTRFFIPFLLFLFSQSSVVDAGAKRTFSKKGKEKRRKARPQKQGPSAPSLVPLPNHASASTVSMSTPSSGDKDERGKRGSGEEKKRKEGAGQSVRIERRRRKKTLPSAFSSRRPLFVLLASTTTSKPYLRLYVLGGLLGGRAVVGVHGLELALGALLLFAVLVLRRHPEQPATLLRLLLLLLLADGLCQRGGSLLSALATKNGVLGPAGVRVR